MNSKSVFLVAIVLVALCAGTEALKCYKCDNCTNVQGYGDVIECNHSPLNSTCVKMWNNTQVIHRGCYIENFCLGNPSCSECFQDKCNASNTLILPLFLINALIFLLFRLY